MSEILDRIAANPNARRGRISKAIAFCRSIDRRKLFETWKLTFAIMGSAGYAGYLSSMNFVLAAISVACILGTGAAVYSMLERSN